MGSVPSNIEAEQALLGALLLSNEVADKIHGLKPEHFYEPVHREIFEVAMGKIAKGELVSPVILRPLLEAHEGLKELGGPEYLARLAGAAISVISAKDYAETIIELSARRDLIAGLELALAEVSLMQDIGATIEGLDAAMAEARRKTSRKPASMTFSKAATLAMERIDEAVKRGTGVDIPTGIPELDEALGGFSDDELIVLGGRPSMGKTALAVEIMRRQARLGLEGIYWSGEMSEESIAIRMIASEAHEGGASYHNAIRGKLNEGQFRTILHRARDMESLPIHIIDPGIRELPVLIREIRRIVRRIRDRGGKIGCVAVDYIQQIRAPGKSRFDQVTEISMSLTALKMELRVPILALAQLSRKLEDRDNKRPNMSDLRESGQIEQDGNKILFCYRDEYYLERRLPGCKSKDIADIEAALTNCRGVMEIIIGKQRSGPIKTVRVGYNAAYNRIFSLDQGQPDEESFI